MLPIERLYRVTLLTERLDAIASEIRQASESLYKVRDAQELIAMGQAQRSIEFAVKALQGAIAEAQAKSAPVLIESQLQASVELIGRSPERLRRTAAKS